MRREGVRRPRPGARRHRRRASVPAAGVFTQNKMTAAPVLVSRHHLDATGGHAAAVVLNSGNANAATGAPGHADAEAMADAVAAALGTASEAVLVCSTGLIGIPLPVRRIVDAAPGLVAAADGDPAAAHLAAEAIRTTDTFAKEVTVAGDGCTVGAMAKGAAMLAPNMATMLAVVTTDAVATPEVLADVLRSAVDASFNVMTTDGCTSTNDTVLLLASGRAGECRVDALRRRRDRGVPVAGADDGRRRRGCDEVGAPRGGRCRRRRRGGSGRPQGGRLEPVQVLVVRLRPLLGRVASELGSAGIAFEQDRVSISYGGHVVAAGGVEIDHDRAAVAAHMAQRDLHVVADLGLGSGRAELFTNDLTHAYVDENMGTS
ncbi:MAG: bifunctional ornithine acetyltransferase/N-acetylglutamate synthase [Acidimicrobiales bacterium]